MKQIRLSVVLLSLLFLVRETSFAAPTSQDTQAQFTAVSGQVKVTPKSGTKIRLAQKGSLVSEGERISVSKNSSATLELFDGSELDLNANTDIALAKMRKPAILEKVLQFKMFVGNVLAKVKKLASAKSSFEIESGGVVCGVRGTQFSLSYDPDKHKVDLHVFEGSVYANKGIFNAGQQIEFINGVLQGKPGGNENAPPEDNEDALDDLDDQFGDGLAVNGDNSFTNPGVAGSLHINVKANVPPAETVP